MPTDPSALDTWAVGAGYEAYVGRWSRLVAREFVRALGVPPHRRWLDVGCGTGALAQAILENAEPDAVVGIDRSEAFIRHARAATSPRAKFQAGDAQTLPVASGGFDAVVSGLVLNFVAAPAKMVAEMVRAGRPGSTVALYVWDYAGRMELMRYFWNAATILDPAAAALDEAARFPICAPDALQALFDTARLVGVTTRAIEVPTVFRDFDDYWAPFLGGQGPAPGYAMSLPAERRIGLRERVRSTLPTAPDGSISLTARAWMVSGSSSTLGELDRLRTPE
jgi:SAM-dependent methyltransferase